ncbi:hypothetical protein FRX31_010578 [Thalictrum thalictroides]|uniref:Uncharacterized protein n=1 Tax=Thalictrum thalictroides TaxID=46969 RepID=A0A7J6WS95_THATH|nr:hypothetical protein FRX31_010578 [Thalictrum thalictroides]
MDKARHMKRQLNNKQSGNNNKINSSNNRDNTEMVCESEGEEEEELRRHSSRSKASSSNTITKKLKLHSKSFIDRNGVDHSKVPRKLRSAMCKRNRESLSPPLSYIKKPHHTALGMEGPRMNGSSNKFKQNSKQEGEEGRIISGTITKDEEEVVETLFSLARMSPEDKPADSKADRRTTEEKSSPLQDTKECSQLPNKASQEESMPSQVVCSAADCTSQSSNLKGSSEQNSWTGLTIMGRPIGYGNNKFELPLGSSAALAGLVRTSLLPSRESNTDAIPLADPSELGVSSEFCHLIGPVQLPQHEVSLRKQSIENGMCPVPNADGKEESKQPALGYKGSDALLACREGTPYLWPGMSRGQSCAGDVHGPSRWSPSTKVPAWLDSAPPSTRNGSIESTVFTEKVKPVIVDRSYSRKRCATHMYICHLIQAYQSSEKKPKWPVHSAQLNLNERTSFSVTATNDLIGRRTDLDKVLSLESTNVLNGYTSTGSTNHSVLGKGPNELQTGNSQERRLQRDHQLSITPSGAYSAEKKNCEFLSLSAGGGGLKHVATTACDSHQQRIGSMPSPQIQAPYLYPVQHYPLMPFSLAHARPASPQSQLPQYMTNSYYYPAHPGHVGCTKQQLEQQQRQMVWAAQLASQYAPGGNLSASLIPCTQPSFSSSPLELPNAKGSQQHQSSFSSSLTGKREHHPLSGVGLQSDVSPQLQLVCGAENI